MRFLCLPVLAASFGYGFANPLPMSPQLQQWFGTASPAQVQTICSMWDSVGGSNSAAVWRASGSNAVTIIEKFTSTLGVDNWANNMDRLTTGDGTGASILRCDSVPGDCPMPSIQCQDFTPPGYYYIRRAIAELYLAFETVQQQLVAQTIVEGLGIAQMVQDFGVKTIKQQESLCASQIAKDTQGAIGIAGGLISAVKDSLPAGPKLAAGIISGLATSIGAALGLAGSNLPSCSTISSDQSAVVAAVSDSLSTIFTSANSQLDTIVAAVYSGKGNLSIIPAQTAEDGETAPIPRFFAGGKWLIPDEADVSGLVTAMMGQWNTMIRKSLVGTLLQSLNLYIYQNTDKSNQNSCSSWDGGARWINNACYLLALDSKGDPASAAINMLNDPSNGNYGIDISDIYSSSISCQSSFPDGTGQVDLSVTNTDGSIPACFYRIPIMAGNGKRNACLTTCAGTTNKLIVSVCESECGCSLTQLQGDPPGGTEWSCPLS